MFKNFIQKRLQKLTVKYLKKHTPKLVVVTGSVGKTGTKLAIATVLAEKYRVRVHEGNHNTHMSVPLAILGVDYPEDVHSISAWLAVFSAINLRIKGEKDVDVIVQELGTDFPGDISLFGTYLHPDIAVVTAVSPEHMEFFHDIEAVAKEELSVAAYSNLTIINRDDIDVSFSHLTETHSIDTYGLSEAAEYRIDLDDASPLEGKMGRFIGPEWDAVSVNLQLVGVHNIKAAVAAGVVGIRLGLSSQQVAVGLSKVTPVAGRMQLLRGMNGSTLIDDTYNSSPLAAIAAIETLYAIDAPQRIAILGSMNELGAFSEEAHKQVALHCDPNKLAWVVTIGKEAATYLAPVALAKGCQVKSFDSPYQAGGFVHGVIEPGAVILAKGSQNGVFAEEALKVLLHSTEDEELLVRQSPAWLQTKSDQFSL
ncbi:UDP-N-acetylmuramoyl-tripeptide--D-alanyl-D-alanine ligase [Pedobacter sp.]|nr:UDP-N-acetylmuramoyl-tripeptide--D-alanyl-D-alanine ligase [Candidatus Saccharibacteria bacterium]